MILEKAITLAVAVHMDQKDKAGEPYILHPLRVMANFCDDLSRVIAVLHDVFEDRPDIKPVGVKEWVGHNGVIALEYLTKHPEQTYHNYIMRLKYNDLAVAIKKADLLDNLDPDRLARLDHQTVQRLRSKYGRALRELEE